MRLIGCKDGGGPKEPAPGASGIVGWCERSGFRTGRWERPRALLAGVELASIAAGMALPPPSFLLTGLIAHRLLTCAARFAIPKPE